MRDKIQKIVDGYANYVANDLDPHYKVDDPIVLILELFKKFIKKKKPEHRCTTADLTTARNRHKIGFNCGIDDYESFLLEGLEKENL